jgi:HemY protein
MAEIEDADGDVGRSREWMARAMRAAPDPAWTADGVVSEHWLPVSPVSGRLDAFQWRVPLAEIGVERPIIEPDKIAPPDDRPPPPAPAETAAAEPEKRVPRRKSSAKAAAERPVEAVIPLVHAPDDPGPDVTPDEDPLDPLPEPPSPAAGAWDRIRQLFR